jgi:hypothetical protein
MSKGIRMRWATECKGIRMRLAVDCKEDAMVVGG